MERMARRTVGNSAQFAWRLGPTWRLSTKNWTSLWTTFSEFVVLRKYLTSETNQLLQVVHQEYTCSCTCFDPDKRGGGSLSQPCLDHVIWPRRVRLLVLTRRVVYMPESKIVNVNVLWLEIKAQTEFSSAVVPEFEDVSRFSGGHKLSMHRSNYAEDPKKLLCIWQTNYQDFQAIWPTAETLGHLRGQHRFALARWLGARSRRPCGRDGSGGDGQAPSGVEWEPQNPRQLAPWPQKFRNGKAQLTFLCRKCCLRVATATWEVRVFKLDKDTR